MQSWGLRHWRRAVCCVICIPIPTAWHSSPVSVGLCSRRMLQEFSTFRSFSLGLGRGCLAFSLVLTTLRCSVTEKALNWEGHLTQANHILSLFTNLSVGPLNPHILGRGPKGSSSRLSRYGGGCFRNKSELAEAWGLALSLPQSRAEAKRCNWQQRHMTT